MANRIASFCALLMATSVITFAQQVDFTITVTDSLQPISPLIYGTNQLLSGNEGWTARRQGGNRMTGYNWENNASNAGNDYYHQSDNYLVDASGISQSNANVPGIVTTTFHDQSITLGTYSLVTLQMAGYVSKDKSGIVSQAETAPSPRWTEVKFEKGSAFSLKPDTSDNYVYMDEYVNFLVNKYGSANTTTGIRGYSLDNETSLWPSTHPRIHPSATTCKEIIQRSIALSRAVKKVDPAAEIFGPAAYGFAEYTGYQGAPDWDSVSKGQTYTWFIDYYLDKMKQAEVAGGKRLMDVLDVHWYPEAIGDHRITDNTATTQGDKLARVQAPRTLWDGTYTENSWIGQYGKAHLPLIPNLLKSINQYYPGTKLAFTEFTYGGEDDISGAIAIADVLGIFAKYGVYFASFWEVGSPSAFVSAAYKVYRNYDGSHSAFADLYAPCQTSDSINCSIYASYKAATNEIHLIVINKNLTQSITGNFNISSRYALVGGKVWRLLRYSSQVLSLDDISDFTDHSFSYSLPGGSVTHFVLQTANTANVPSDGSVPEGYYLRAFPNPFNPNCKIEYSVQDDSNSRIDIISVTGELVKSYHNLAHQGSITWDASNQTDQKVSSGWYVAVLRNETTVFMRQKLMLLK